MAKDEANSLGTPQVRERARLIDERYVVDVDGEWVFQEITLFDKPKAATSIIAGYPTDGHTAWMNNNDETLAEYLALE